MSNIVKKRRVIYAENKVKKRIDVKGGNKSKLDKRSLYQKEVDRREKYLVKKGSKRKKNIVKNARNPVHVKPIDR